LKYGFPDVLRTELPSREGRTCEVAE